MIRADVRNNFTNFSIDFEGSVSWMYLDMHRDAAGDLEPLVTVGIGNQVGLAAALALPFVRPNGQPATQDEIGSAWRKVSGRVDLATQGYKAFEHLTDLRLTYDGIVQSTLAELDSDAAILNSHLPTFVTAPADAQLLALSMAWAMGANFPASYPKFSKLYALEDFAEWKTLSDGTIVFTGGCAVECWMHDEQNPGLHPRNIANQRLAYNAAMVMNGELSREVLHYPAQVLSTVVVAADDDNA